MKISYKAVYTLLESKYKRRSLSQIVYQDTPENIFEASKLFALQEEDYSYLAAMVEHREDLDKRFCLFLDGQDKLPVIIRKDEDVDLTELSIICTKCPLLNVKAFEEVIVAQAGDRNAEELLQEFNVCYKIILSKKTVQPK